MNNEQKQEEVRSKRKEKKTVKEATAVPTLNAHKAPKKEPDFVDPEQLTGDLRNVAAKSKIYHWYSFLLYHVMGRATTSQWALLVCFDLIWFYCFLLTPIFFRLGGSDIFLTFNHADISMELNIDTESFLTSRSEGLGYLNVKEWW